MIGIIIKNDRECQKKNHLVCLRILGRQRILHQMEEATQEEEKKERERDNGCSEERKRE